jgi:hypothetical protein
MIECDFAEWDVGHGGISQNMEVEVREEASPGTRSGDSTALLVNNTPAYPVADHTLGVPQVGEPSRRRKPDGRGRPRPSKRPSLDTTPDGHVHAGIPLM